MIPPPPRSTLFPYTTLFRSATTLLKGQDDKQFAIAGFYLGWNYAKLSRLTEARSEEHTSELQSRRDLVCRLLLEKKKKKYSSNYRENMPVHPSHIVTYAPLT